MAGKGTLHLSAGARLKRSWCFLLWKTNNCPLRVARIGQCLKNA